MENNYKKFNVRRGQFYYVDLPKGRGSIQAGMRPVIIVSNDIECKYSPTLKVCPCTSKIKKDLPAHVNIGIIKNQLIGNNLRECTILTEQIFTIQRSELVNYIGHATTDQIKQLNRCISVSIGLVSVKEREIISIVQELKKLNYTLDIMRQNMNMVDYKLINNIRKKIEYKELELENTCRRLHLNIKEYYTPVAENTDDVKMVNIK